MKGIPLFQKMRSSRGVAIAVLDLSFGEDSLRVGPDSLLAMTA
jgi:hypothetical protein